MNQHPTFNFSYFLLGLLPVVLLLTSCGGGGVAKLTFQLDGPCEECPARLVDSLIGTIPNLMSHKVENNQIMVEFDSTKLKTSEFIIALNKLGFNYETDLADDDTTPEVYCCKKAPDPDDPLQDDDEEPLDIDNEAELDVELDSPQEQENLDEELADDLMIDEEDLLLEQEPKPKKKKKQ
jgi:hypothetical protein